MGSELVSPVDINNGDKPTTPATGALKFNKPDDSSSKGDWVKSGMDVLNNITTSEVLDPTTNLITVGLQDDKTHTIGKSEGLYSKPFITKYNFITGSAS